MSLAAGEILGGDFELVRPLGEGGMGVVWLALERPLGRHVALKVMRPSESQTRANRFEREARALAALNHPSIISVLRTGVDSDSGLHYIATPAILLTQGEIRNLCDNVLGCPYPKWADAHRPDIANSGSRGSSSSETSVGGMPLTLADFLDGGKALPETAVARIARDLAGALAAAHAAGILHRDVKPSNILFDATGRALLADFGLAKFTAAAMEVVGGGAVAPRVCSDSISLDGAGNPKFLGTPSYAAPEAFKKGLAATPALDWYSLGAVLYEALTGDRPRSLRAPSSYDREHISRAWDPLLRDLLEPDPARRLADHAAFLRRLDRIGRKPRRLWRALALAGCAAGVAIAVALAWAGFGSRKSVAAAEAGSREQGSATGSGGVRPPGEHGSASPMPPRLGEVWQGENRGPLQRLNTFAMPVVDDLVAKAIEDTDDETRRLLAEGDAAWAEATKLGCGKVANRVGIATAEAAYSNAVARLRAVSGGDDHHAGNRAGEALQVARAVALARLAWTYVINARHGAADAPYAAALAAIEPLVEKDEPRYAPLKSWLLAERAYMECMEGRYEESVADLTESLALWDFNTMRSWSGCAIQEAVLLASLGGMRFISNTEGTGNDEQDARRDLRQRALDDTDRAIALMEEIAGEDDLLAPRAGGADRPLADFLAGCHYRRGEICFSLSRRQESLEAYERACALWKSLGKRYEATYCQALGRFNGRLYAMEETARSVEVGAELLGIIKPYAERNRARYGAAYKIALRNQINTLDKIGDMAGAEAVAAELQAFEGKGTGKGNAPAAK